MSAKHQLIAFRAHACVFLMAGIGIIHSDSHAAEKAEVENIGDLLTDSAAGHVSASSLLGLPSDAVSTVENARGFVAAIKGLGTPNTGMGISLSPARTSILPMSIDTYNKGVLYRLLGSATLSYAQGTAKVAQTDLQRRAYGIEVSAVLDDAFDPVIGYLKRADRCKWEPPDTQPGKGEDVAGANKKYADCVEAKMKQIGAKWNVSRMSFSLGSGAIKTPEASSESLGRTLAASLTYGFDHFGIASLRDNAALVLTYRRTNDAPVLDSLLTNDIKRVSSKLAAVRFTYGSDSVRGLIEHSRSSDHEATADRRVFKYAFGADMRLAEGLWLAIRSGKQRKSTGTGDEAVTLLDLSYSFSGKSTL